MSLLSPQPQERAETDFNYASIFSRWGRLFGPYRERYDYSTLCFGLLAWGGERYQSLRELFATPLFPEPDAVAGTPEEN